MNYCYKDNPHKNGVGTLWPGRNSNIFQEGRFFSSSQYYTPLIIVVRSADWRSDKPLSRFRFGQSVPTPSLCGSWLKPHAPLFFLRSSNKPKGLVKQSLSHGWTASAAACSRRRRHVRRGSCLFACVICMQLGWAAPPSAQNEPLLLRHSATGTPAAGVDASADGDDYVQRGR